MSIKNLSVTAASNTASPPYGSPEGCTMASINDTIRQTLADIRTLAAADTIAAAGTTDLGSKDNTFLTLTGTATTITALGTVSAGIYKAVIYNAAHTVTHNATSLILMGGASRTVAAGDVSLFISEGSGNWRELVYQKADGTPIAVSVASATGTLAIANGGTGQTAKTAAFDALSPNTTQGDITYHNGTNNVRLAAGTSGYYLKSQGAGANPTWAAVSAGSTITAGTPCVLNPFSTSSTTTQAHGLSAQPTWYRVYLECLTADLNYSIGDIVECGVHGPSQASAYTAWVVVADTTNVKIITNSAGNPLIPNKTSYVDTAITAANWKLTVVPYKFA